MRVRINALLDETQRSMNAAADAMNAVSREYSDLLNKFNGLQEGVHLLAANVRSAETQSLGQDTGMSVEEL